MLLTVRSDFPIMAAIWFCVAVGFVCTTRSTAISSKVQDLHFRGWLSAKFALWTAPFALWTSSLVSPSFQSMCNSRFRKLSRVRGQVLEPSIYNWEMARTARKHSDSGVYHVILRGVKRIIGDRCIDPKEWTNVPVPMTLMTRGLGGGGIYKSHRHALLLGLWYLNQAYRAHRKTLVATAAVLRIEINITEVQVICGSVQAGCCAWPVAAARADIFERSPPDVASCRQEESLTIFCKFISFISTIPIFCRIIH